MLTDYSLFFISYCILHCVLIVNLVEEVLIIDLIYFFITQYI